MPSQNGRLVRPFDFGLKLARTCWICLSQGDFGEAEDRDLPRLAASGHERNLLSAPCGDLPDGLFLDRAVESYF